MTFIQANGEVLFTQLVLFFDQKRPKIPYPSPIQGPKGPTVPLLHAVVAWLKECGCLLSEPKLSAVGENA